MKKFLISIAVALPVLLLAGMVFREPLVAWLEGSITSDMFVSQDDDAYDPGIAVGEQFPPIRALYAGREIDSIQPFIADRGLVFIAVRSADW